MKRTEYTVSVEEYSYDELSAADRSLVDSAVRATDNSYSPYSHFRVGAAIRLADGSIVMGANQENAAFPVTICAERAAIFAAQSAHPELAITTVAIAAKNADGITRRPVSPCGSCRQVILEMEQRYQQPVRIILHGREATFILRSARDLLPLCFVDADMR